MLSAAEPRSARHLVALTAAAVVDLIRALPRDERLRLYLALPPGALASQRYRPEFWARPEQALPLTEELATIEVARGGRGSGKTWWAVQLFNREILAGRARRPRIIAATDAAVLSTVIDGPSGIRTWLPPDVRPTFTRSTGYAGTLYYPSVGVTVLCCSAQKPGQAVGQGCDLTLADDPAGWIESNGENLAEKTFRQARVSNREARGQGLGPCMIVPTTKRGVSFLRRLLTPGQMAGIRLRKLGETKDNTNLSPQYIRDTIVDLESEGDDWAAEELRDEDRDEAPGALWKRNWIDSRRVVGPPDLERVVVAVDPADDGRENNDATGISVAALGFDGRLYVLADYTAKLSADQWPAIVAWAFRYHKADAIVAEVQRSKSLVRRLLHIEAPNVPLVEVDALRGKHLRAEPLVLAYRDGRVSHVIDGPQLSRARMVKTDVPVYDPASGRRDPKAMAWQRDRRSWLTLEDELCGWEPRKSKSPNGLDALVWACWHLRPPDGGGAWEPTPSTPVLGGGSVDPRAPITPAADPRRPMRWRDRR